MKKKIFAGLLASATVLGLFAAGGTAFAAQVDNTDTWHAGMAFALGFIRAELMGLEG